MTRGAWSALLACALSTAAMAERLTLDEALAAVSAAHPDRRIAESELELARADREQAASLRDFNVFLDGALREGRRSDIHDWESDNIGRIVARKPLLDFGRSSQAIAAGDQDIAARQAALLDVESLRRIDIMARYFDVLLADMQYAADNEFMAVAYVSWDNAQDRFEVGQISQPELLRLEADYQDIRERRNASQQRMRSTRQKLAHAILRPDLPDELEEPALADNARPVPAYEALLPWVMENNPRVRALQAQLVAADARLAAIRAERNPVLDAEVIGGAYSRESTTRDELSAGLVFNVPLYQGRRVDSRIARELALKERSAAELEKLRLDLADTLLATLQEIEWLRGSGRPAADKQIEYRDWALERSRAEYELELKTNLGPSMADTQVAQLRRRQVEYRLALALARLEALCGGSLPPVEGEPE